MNTLCVVLLEEELQQTRRSEKAMDRCTMLAILCRCASVSVRSYEQVFLHIFNSWSFLKVNVDSH